MRAWIPAGIVTTIVVLAGCTGRPPLAPEGTPLPPQQQEITTPRTVLLLSAAAPRASGSVNLPTATLFAKATAAVKALDLSKDLPHREFRIQDPDYAFVCSYSRGVQAEESQVLACRFGEAFNTVTGHALFWRHGGDWKASYYPQASDEVRRSRQAYFNSMGANCPVGCAGGFTSLRQEGNRMLAVVDLSSVASRSTEEVQLLERDKQKDSWHILWVPSPDAFSYQGHPKITLPQTGIAQFNVTRQDRTSQTWQLQGAQFVLQ